jgi:hypothetical protein
MNKNLDLLSEINRLWQIGEHRKRLEALVIPAAIRLAGIIVNALPNDCCSLANGYEVARENGKPTKLKKGCEFAIDAQMTLHHAYTFAQEAEEVVRAALRDQCKRRDQAKKALQELAGKKQWQ